MTENEEKETHNKFYNEILDLMDMDNFFDDIVKNNPAIMRAHKRGNTDLCMIEDFPLKEWDKIAAYMNTPTINKIIKDKGEWPSLSVYVCIVKSGARKAISKIINKEKLNKSLSKQKTKSGKDI